ncbi:hypothetical protein ACMYUJ_21385 [Stutzerimonas zhaodongensis]|uniref:hypothetical protein n=1 Tax=Stutzerimonas zhaodongensis TaxID=1176257 RepID=UPI0039F0E220
MSIYQIVLCTVLSLGVLGTGALLDYRNLDRDRAARTTDFANPNTLLTGRAKQKEDDTNGKATS